jgi:hypothetical protein
MVYGRAGSKSHACSRSVGSTIPAQIYSRKYRKAEGQKMKTPSGKIKVKSVEQRGEPLEDKTYATVVCEDEKGKLWEFHVVAYTRLMQERT